MWTRDERKNLNFKKLITLLKGKYHYEEGLYITLSRKKLSRVSLMITLISYFDRNNTLLDITNKKTNLDLYCIVKKLKKNNLIINK